MRVLVYKRTHTGDPSSRGVFGEHDCMGSVRGRDYDAVIGVGGIGPEPIAEGIAGRVTWIGIGPYWHASPKQNARGPMVSFDRFLLEDTQGPKLVAIAPKLARHMYETNRRVVIIDETSTSLYGEVLDILQRAADSPPSPNSGQHIGQDRSKVDRCRRISSQ